MNPASDICNRCRGTKAACCANPQPYEKSVMHYIGDGVYNPEPLYTACRSCRIELDPATCLCGGLAVAS